MDQTSINDIILRTCRVVAQIAIEDSKIPRNIWDEAIRLRNEIDNLIGHLK